MYKGKCAGCTLRRYARDASMIEEMWPGPRLRSCTVEPRVEFKRVAPS